MSTFKISNFCLESRPCMHHVAIDGKYQESPWGAIKIIEYCEHNHMPVPQHFSYLWKDRFQYINKPELVETADNEDESPLFSNR